MSFKIISAKLTGNPDTSGWSQAYEFEPEDVQKLKLRGKLYALISTSSQKEGLDTVVLGREVLLRLHEEYFGKTDTKPFTALKEALKKVEDEFSSWEDIQIAAISQIKDVVYMAVSGGAKTFLFREGKLIKLIESSSGNTVAASGHPKDGDMFLIGTSLFYQHIPRGILKGFLQAKDPKVIVESFAPLIHSQEFEGNLGVIILRFNHYFPEEKLHDFTAPISPQQEKRFQEKWTPKLSMLKEAQLKAKSNFLGISKILGKGGLYLKTTYLNESTNPKKKTSAFVGGLLLIILSVSIYFGITQKRKNDFRQSYESQLGSAEHELQEAYDLSELNPQRSRELFDQARSKVLGLTTQEIDDPKVGQLQERIRQGEEKILGQYQADPQLFVDLSLFSDGFSGDETAFSEESLFLLDKEEKKIIKVSLVNKKTESLAGPSVVNESKTIAAYSDRVFTLNSDGVYELDGDRKKVIDNDWEADALIQAYAGNLYILDKTASKVYRYSGTDEGFGSKKEWFSEGTNVDLTGSKNFCIDGAVWVTSAPKEIIKFSYGVLQNFSLKGIFPEVQNIDDIFTTDDSVFIYILEKDQERIIVVDKNGEYKAQYSSGKIKDVSKIVASEKEKKLFLLIGEQLLFLDLKHL